MYSNRQLDTGKLIDDRPFGAFQVTAMVPCALAALVHPTALRSTGIGWAMGMGRAGQVVATLATGLAAGLGWNSAQVFLALGLAPLRGAVSVMAMRWHASRLPAAEAVT